MAELKLTSIIYHSPGDERAFFEWLQGIPSVEKVWGVGPDLFVRVSDGPLPVEDLRELIALVKRYPADAAQLRQFRNADNKHLFHDG